MPSNKVSLNISSLRSRSSSTGGEPNLEGSAVDSRGVGSKTETLSKLMTIPPGRNFEIRSPHFRKRGSWTHHGIGGFWGTTPAGETDTPFGVIRPYLDGGASTQPTL